MPTDQRKSVESEKSVYEFEIVAMGVLRASMLNRYCQNTTRFSVQLTMP